MTKKPKKPKKPKKSFSGKNKKKSHAWGKSSKKRFDDKKNKNTPPSTILTNGPKIRLGLFQATGPELGVLVPCSRKDSFYAVRCERSLARQLQEGEVVLYVLRKNQTVEIIERLGLITDPRIFSRMVIKSQQLLESFSEEAEALAQKSIIPPLGRRVDLRKIPFVTIDGEDAKDFDDAVWATPYTDDTLKGGWHLRVAIADVCYYVRPKSALDKEAYGRGNSVYFADSVLPMLPETLSNGLCSLRPDEDRAALVADILLTATGEIHALHFERALIRSKARLTYTEVQKAIDSKDHPLWNTVLAHLYGTYKALKKARIARQTIEFDLPERRAIVDEKTGCVQEIALRTSLESHQLIEEMMIAANVCAAKALLAVKSPTIFRVHDEPDPTRVDNFQVVLRALNLYSGKKAAAVQPQFFNTVLKKVKGLPEESFVNELALRCQSQAIYSEKNKGHFGLALKEYCHFTSPIRRYSDLIVHRVLVEAFKLGEGAKRYTAAELTPMAIHISAQERVAVSAEREVMDRYTIRYLEERIGQTFKATVSGVTRVGIFFSLEGSGAQGFFPKHLLPGDHYIYDAQYHRFVGARTKRTFQLGHPLHVILEGADAATNRLSFSFVNEESSSKANRKKKHK